MEKNQSIKITDTNGDFWEISRLGNDLRLTKNAMIIAYALKNDAFSQQLFFEAVERLFNQIRSQLKSSFPLEAK